MNAVVLLEITTPRPQFGAFLFDNLLMRQAHRLDGEIGRHSGLKIRRFVHSGRTGSIPVRGTKKIHASPAKY
jgi:hypothetical protein